jgi:hypothetical protein
VRRRKLFDCSRLGDVSGRGSPRCQQGVADAGEFGGHELADFRRDGGAHKAGVREVPGGALVTTGQAVDEQNRVRNCM